VIATHFHPNEAAINTPFSLTPKEEKILKDLNTNLDNLYNIFRDFNDERLSQLPGWTKDGKTIDVHSLYPLLNAMYNTFSKIEEVIKNIGANDPLLKKETDLSMTTMFLPMGYIGGMLEESKDPPNSWTISKTDLQTYIGTWYAQLQTGLDPMREVVDPQPKPQPNNTPPLSTRYIIPLETFFPHATTTSLIDPQDFTKPASHPDQKNKTSKKKSHLNFPIDIPV
jgi:hypothetical protein